MNVAHRFEAAVLANTIAALPANTSDQCYLIVSGLNLSRCSYEDLATGNDILKIALAGQVDVDETLNTITEWIRDNDILNQSRQHDQFGKYNISFHFVDEGGVYPSVTHEFLLHEYVFAGNDGENPGNFDGLMIMLDRHLLAKDMRGALMQDERYNIPERENPAAFWCKYILQSSHPEYRRQMATCRHDLVHS